jgi:hypothetical protein
MLFLSLLFLFSLTVDSFKPLSHSYLINARNPMSFQYPRHQDDYSYTDSLQYNQLSRASRTTLRNNLYMLSTSSIISDYGLGKRVRRRYSGGSSNDIDVTGSSTALLFSFNEFAESLHTFDFGEIVKGFDQAVQTSLNDALGMPELQNVAVQDLDSAVESTKAALNPLGNDLLIFLCATIGK